MGYFCIVLTNLSIFRKKTHIHVQNHPCGTVGAKAANELAFLGYGMIVVVFGWNVFFVDWHLLKTINMARMSIEERAQAVGMISAGTPIRQVCYASL